jgi:hypothetical protein
MTRGLLLANGLAAVIAAAGLGLLVRPVAAARLLRLPAGEPATQGLRILGAMLFAAALFLAGFATAYQLASAT